MSNKNIIHGKLMIIFVSIIMGSCNDRNDLVEQNNFVNIKIDTVISKIGNAHDKVENVFVDIRKIEDSSLLSYLVEDSIVDVYIDHNFNVSMKLISLSKTFSVSPINNHFRISTNSMMDTIKEEKVKLGYVVDTSKFVLLYHYKYFDSNDSSNVHESFKRVDTVGWTEITMYDKG